MTTPLIHSKYSSMHKMSILFPSLRGLFYAQAQKPTCIEKMKYFLTLQYVFCIASAYLSWQEMHSRLLFTAKCCQTYQLSDRQLYPAFKDAGWGMPLCTVVKSSNNTPALCTSSYLRTLRNGILTWHLYHFPHLQCPFLPSYFAQHLVETRCRILKWICRWNCNEWYLSGFIIPRSAVGSRVSADKSDKMCATSCPVKTMGVVKFSNTSAVKREARVKEYIGYWQVLG